MVDLCPFAELDYCPFARSRWLQHVQIGQEFEDKSDHTFLDEAGLHAPRLDKVGTGAIHRHDFAVKTVH